MSVIHNDLLLSDDGYNLQRSLRFRSSASAYLSRTPSSAGNRQKWTWSGWVKRGSLGVLSPLFSANPVASAWNVIRFNASDILQVGYDDASLGYCFYQTSAVFRDPSAWYHVVIASDTTQATAANRVLIYVNGVQQTTSQVFASQVMPQNFNWQFNNSVAHRIYSLNDGGSNTYFDGYLTEQNFIDGQALTPSSFGENNTLTGVWQPKKYSGTYGTNGFYLPFSDNTSTTTLGYDKSGNSNNWTCNNISLTSGATYDSMTDVPTQAQISGNGNANYCTLNPLAKASAQTVSDGNLNLVDSASNSKILGTLGVDSGKWYWEITPYSGSLQMIGVALTTSPINQYVGQDANSWCWYQGNGGVKINNSSQVSYATFTNNDVIGVALDLSAGTLTFYKNGTSQGTAYSSLPSGTYTPSLGYNGSMYANFGQRPFAYTPPTGFKALNTYNLPTPTIGALPSSRANKYFDATTYTGNGSTQSITNTGGFQPDLVWIKIRSQPYSNHIADSVRGANKIIYSNLTNAETTTNTITAFNSNGFSVSTNSGADVSTNANNEPLIGWQWKGANGSVSNTSGSITSTVSANTTSGFSVVTYTGTGGTATVGHGLGVAPKFVIVKSRSLSSTNWVVYTTATGSMRYAYLNSTSAGGVPSESAPTSSVFSVSAPETNTSSATYVAYCFAEVAGFSKFGSYTGNGSSDGTFVYTGFRPRYLMVKRTDSTGNWAIHDTSRSTYNQIGDYLLANSSDAEVGGSVLAIDAISNGFKLRVSQANQNASGGTYIYAAFAEHPFKYSLAR